MIKQFSGPKPSQKLLTPEKTRILVIDDTRVSQRAIQQRLLAQGYRNIELAESTAQIQTHIQTQINNFKPDIIILDWMMPQVNGLLLTKMIRAQNKLHSCYTYVIMVTGKDSESAMIKAFKEGVDDFIAKADLASQLVPRMMRALTVLNQMQSQSEKTQLYHDLFKQQERLVTFDKVSQLPSANGFNGYFSRAIKFATSRNQGLVCLLVSIKNYEHLKKTSSDLAMNRIIRLFSDKLIKLMRPTDFIARTAPAEFCCILHTQQKSEINTLDRIERHLNHLSIKTTDGYYILDIKTAGVTIRTDAFQEDWNETELQALLRDQAQQELPISNRLRHSWPALTLS